MVIKSAPAWHNIGKFHLVEPGFDGWISFGLSVHMSIIMTFGGGFLVVYLQLEVDFDEDLINSREDGCNYCSRLGKRPLNNGLAVEKIQVRGILNFLDE